MSKGKRFRVPVSATATCWRHGGLMFPVTGDAPDVKAGRKVLLTGRCPEGHEVVVEHTVP